MEYVRQSEDQLYSVCCVVFAVSRATWILFTGVHARRVVLRVRCIAPLGSCSQVCTLGTLCCLCGILAHLAPVHWCARSACCIAFAVSLATWLLLTGVYARRVVLRVSCPGPVGSCSPVRTLGVLCCVCGVLSHLAPVHWFVRLVCCVVCAVSLATWLLVTGVPARRILLCVRCPGPLGSCSPVCSLGVLCCVLRVRCPGPLGSCSLVCALGMLCRTCGQSLRGAQGLGTLRLRTRPSGRRLFCSRQWPDTQPGAHSSIRTAVVPYQGRGWLPCRVALVNPDDGCCCLAPLLVPWFVACCARCPGLQHLVVVVASHLSVCLGCGRRRASRA